MRKFTKIRWDGDEVMIAFTEDRRDGRDSVTETLTSRDVPLESFDQAMKKLAPRIEKRGALQKGAVTEVRSLALRWDKKDATKMQVIYTALHDAEGENSPFVFNTPLMDADTQRGGLVAGVIAQAEKYLDGKRAQIDIQDG